MATLQYKDGTVPAPKTDSFELIPTGAVMFKKIEPWL